MKASIQQRLIMEALTGKHTKTNGTLRKKNRSIVESYNQGFPVDAFELIKTAVSQNWRVAREVIVELGFEDPQASRIKYEIVLKKLQNYTPNLKITKRLD